MFQFLVGSVEIILTEGYIEPDYEFQFLVGSVEIFSFFL